MIGKLVEIDDWNYDDSNASYIHKSDSQSLFWQIIFALMHYPCIITFNCQHYQGLNELNDYY